MVQSGDGPPPVRLEAGDSLPGPLKVKTAADQLVDRLITAIALGVLLPGQKLPPEREFAVRLDVSRTTLRDAMHQLGLLVYGHSSMTIRAIDEYRVEAARCLPAAAITELTFGASGFQVVWTKPARYAAVVRFGRALLIVRGLDAAATRRAGDLERALCVFANDCAPRFGLPAAVDELVAGAPAWAAVLAVDEQPEAPALGRAVATASEMGYRTSVASVDCDDGARTLLGLPAGTQHRYVAVYFGSREDADAFAASATMTPLAVVPVRTYCIG